MTEALQPGIIEKMSKGKSFFTTSLLEVEIAFPRKILNRDFMELKRGAGRVLAIVIGIIGALKLPMYEVFLGSDPKPFRPAALTRG